MTRLERTGSDSPDAASEASNYFDRLFTRSVAAGRTDIDARTTAFEAYLDGKPNGPGRKKLTRTVRDTLFWSSRVVEACTPKDWSGEAAILALASYLSQTQVSIAGLVHALVDVAPDALILAARRSELVLLVQSPHRKELVDCSHGNEEVAELCRVLDIFANAHRERMEELGRWKSALADLTAFDLLTLASLYAFEHLVAHTLTSRSAAEAADERIDSHWQAINQLLVWKLGTMPAETAKINDESIGRSLQQHLIPLLFPGPGDAAALARRRQAFASLVDAQFELDEFLSRSIDAFRYDDSIRFVRVGESSLDIVETDPAARSKWFRDSKKLDRLHGYWLHRAFYDFARSDLAHQCIGLPDNEDENRLAYIRAMRTHLRLTEVFGIADTVSTDSGETVDVFQALLALELTSRFFMLDFLVQFSTHAHQHLGDWVTALRALAFNGLREGMQNRFPLTWSSRTEKVKRITGWTVTPAHPQGDARMAAAILDFWTFDMAITAERLQQGTPGLRPRLIERPVLKFGQTLVQLPWVAGLQNNNIAAINNLRRLSTQRGETRDETQRIEAGLARELAARGFRVVLNWMPPDEAKKAGEVDVMAALDGRLFLFEVKSTFVRQSVRDAWLHSTSTLRKAGLQLKRKLPVILAALETDAAFRQSLDLVTTPQSGWIHSWIIDTSIECDHEHFSGFLKVSLEEVLLALRDDCHLLDDPEGLMAGQLAESQSVRTPRGTLYAEGFRAERFAEVIETEHVWATL